VSLAPSGRQFEIRHGPRRAVATELGAALRCYEVAGRAVLDGFAHDAPVTGSRGMPLLPWPNRIEDGRYVFGGEEHQLPINDPADGHAIHGLTRWVPWTAIEQTASRVELGTTLFPQPGYPFTLALSVAYGLTDGGLLVETTATNRGARTLPYGAGFHPYLSVAGGRVDDARVAVPASAYRPFGARWLPCEERDVTGTPFDLRDGPRVGDLELIACYSGLTRDADGRARVRVDDTTLWMDETLGFVLLFSGDTLPVPAERRRSLAVEPMTCPPNAFRSGVGVIVLEPGESTTIRWGLTP
jgi:aldose 1-epimerase